MEERQESQCQNDEDWKKRHWPLLALKIEEATSWGFQEALRSWTFKETDFPSSLQKGKCLIDPLILAQWDPSQTSDLQNC